jgi:hypothetical protein
MLFRMRHFLAVVLSLYVLIVAVSLRSSLADAENPALPMRFAPFGIAGPVGRPQAGQMLAGQPDGKLQAVDPGMQCRQAVSAAGRAAGIPDHMMSAIARIESGRRSTGGRVDPWPWSINVEGVDHVFDTRDQAVAAVRALQAGGTRSIDVGCMQVNLLHHPTAFASLEQGFDPAGNAAYAARFLMQLFRQTGTWPKAVAAYHSFTPELGDAYERKVSAVMAEETRSDLAMVGGAAGSRGLAGGFSPGTVALMLGNRADAARIIPLAGGEAMRSLDAYRAAPVRVASRGP